MTPSPLAAHWTLDPAVAFLNHGSFGATPRPVLAAQQAWRDRMEREPVRFFLRELPALLDAARGALAAFLRAPADDVVFVPNASHGVNAVLRSLDLAPGDELLTTDHEYRACHNALAYAAERAGARVVVARVPYPVADPGEVVAAVLAAASARTRLALVDHVTSQTALVLPVEAVVRALADRGVETLVDGAHAPGMLPLDVPAVGAAYYTGNCHKWLCAPKGAAFLYVRRDRQRAVRPLAISHAGAMPACDPARFQCEFGWTGTDDPTAFLAVPDALAFMDGLFPGGWDELRARNRRGALEARAILCDALGVAPPCPDEMVGATATVALPDRADAPAGALFETDPLQDRLLYEYAVEVPVIPWPAAPKRLVRVSSQAYNTRAQYEHLARALRALLGA